MRLGIFGGSFDPVHNGHLELAKCCQRQAALDEIWFTPTAIQPLKHGGPQASNKPRLEMLQLAIDIEPSEPGRGHRRAAMVGPRSTWRICTLEIQRGGFSYTVETLRKIHTELPDAELFFLLGADTLRDLPHWKEPAEIFGLATPLVVHRAGQPQPDLSALIAICPADHPPQLFDMRSMSESSTDIRRRIALGEPVSEFVPPTVAQYIEEHGIYR